MEEQELYLLITRYLSKQTSTSENEELADWLIADKRNEQTFEEIKRVWLGYKRRSGTDSVYALAKLRAKIAAEDRESRLRKVQRRKYRIAIAASVILLVGGWLTFTLLRPATNIAYQSLTTLRGQKKRIILKDGTRVTLGPESLLSWPESFDKDLRTVHVTGEAYFEVSKNPHAPFTVQTLTMSIQVLGTHFNVNARKNQTLNTVSLLEGKVRVKLKNGLNEEYSLRPGEELSVNRANQVFQHQLDSAAVLGWLNNVLIFKNEELEAIAPRIERMYGVKIVFTDQATADTRIYATFNNQPLAEIMKTICASGTLSYRQEGKNIYINLIADKKR